MKGQIKASTPAEYLAKLDEPRRSEVAALDTLIRKTAPKLEPFIHGAGHESGRRAGTENVPYIVALGKACELALQSLPQVIDRLRLLRDRLWRRLQDALGERVPADALADVHGVAAV